MSKQVQLQRNWLRFMYIYTIAVAGSFGLAILVTPALVVSRLGLPAQDPIMFGVTGSVYLAFAFLSILGLRAPLKFAPILLLQLFYKLVWFIGLAAPLFVQGQFPVSALSFVVIFASFVIGDLIAIPFRYLLAKEAVV